MMSLDANSWVIIIGAIGLILTQIVTMILAYMREQAKIIRDDAAAAKLVEIVTTTDTIHQLTNSGMSEVRNELVAARDEIRGLQQMRVDEAHAVNSTADRPPAKVEIVNTPGAPVPVTPITPGHGNPTAASPPALGGNPTRPPQTYDPE